MKRLPPRLRCEVCGDIATVLADNLRVWNEICALPAGHPRRAEGVWMDTECPNCGINRQAIYPPDKDEQREIIITGEGMTNDEARMTNDGVRGVHLIRHSDYVIRHIPEGNH